MQATVLLVCTLLLVQWRQLQLHLRGGGGLGRSGTGSRLSFLADGNQLYKHRSENRVSVFSKAVGNPRTSGLPGSLAKCPPLEALSCSVDILFAQSV